MKRLMFIIGFTIYVLFILMSCTGTKHLIKSVNKAFEKKDSTGKSDSVIVCKDSSTFNSEIVIEYDSTKLTEKLINGSDPDWSPFYTPEEFEKAIKSIGHPVKRVTIKTNVQLHKSDSAVYHAQAKVKTVSKEVSVNKEVNKKTRSYWWAFLLLIPIIFLLYQKYKSKLKWLLP